jgi:hypothetical protein
MLEPIQIDSLDQLSDVTVEVTIKMPNGQDGIVKVKALSAATVRDIRRQVKWPAPPVKDYKKFGNEATPIYDYNDPTYKAADEDADQELARRMLVASLVMTIPGDTVEEKSKALEDRLGQFAYMYLVNAVNRINTPQAEDIQNMMRSFRPVGSVRASDNGGPLTYPEHMEKFIHAG